MTSRISLSKSDSWEDESWVRAGDTTWADQTQAQAEAPVLPMQRGWLRKRSRHWVRGWLQRYFVLKNKTLSYYRMENDPFPKGVFDFDQLTVTVHVSPATFELTIVPLQGRRRLRLKCAHLEDLWAWAYAVHAHVRVSLGAARDMTVVGMQKYFWRRTRIAERDFAAVASTGDLLLFRSKSMASRFQRLVTRSHYDHVALLLRYSNGQLMLLEATAGTGVALVPWDEFLGFRWNVDYRCLALRRLEYTRKDEMLVALGEFLEDVVGKRYRITASKLLRRARNRKPGSEDSYFCSELVAAALKRLQLLPDDIPAANYLPGAFARANALPLQRGALYGDELVIDFSM